jgi:hypothetical protein
MVLLTDALKNGLALLDQMIGSDFVGDFVVSDTLENFPHEFVHASMFKQGGRT